MSKQSNCALAKNPAEATRRVPTTDLEWKIVHFSKDLKAINVQHVTDDELL